MSFYYRLRGSNIRYFKVLSNTIQRSRAAPPTGYEKEQTSSNIIKYYSPAVRQKI